MNPSTKALRWAAIAAFALTTTAAQAATFDLNYTGNFIIGTTLDGVSLASNTPFSITATFDGDPSLNKFTTFSGIGIFEITALSLTLTGYGTYAAVTGPDLNVFLQISPSTRSAGLSEGSGLGSRLYSSFNNNSDPSFDPAAPSPFSFSDYSSSFSSYTIPLSGVSAGLAINGFGISSATASITAAAVPEPSEYAAVTGLALGVFALVQRRRKAAGR